jgi:hypothetical protein
MFVTTVLLNGTKPESAKVLVFVYVRDGSHERTHDDLAVVHEVDLQQSTQARITLSVLKCLADTPARSILMVKQYSQEVP